MSDQHAASRISRDNQTKEACQLVPISQTPDHKDTVMSSKATEIDADIGDFIPTPPDGGYGWIICIASFMNHVILDGICYAFGIFMSSYSNYFNSSAGATSVLMSSLIGCYMLSGEWHAM